MTEPRLVTPGAAERLQGRREARALLTEPDPVFGEELNRICDEIANAKTSDDRFKRCGAVVYGLVAFGRRAIQDGAALRGVSPSAFAADLADAIDRDLGVA